MRLPESVHFRVLYVLYNTTDLRKGLLKVDPKWLDIVEYVLRNAPLDEMRNFFEQYFCQHLSTDDALYNLYIERSTLYVWRDYFLWHVALLAAQEGLIQVWDRAQA